MNSQIDKEKTIKILEKLFNTKNKNFAIFSIVMPHTYTEGHEIISTVRQLKNKQKDNKSHKVSYAAIPAEKLDIFLNLFSLNKHKAVQVTEDLSQEFSKNVVPQFLSIQFDSFNNTLSFHQTITSYSANILLSDHKKIPTTINEIKALEFLYSIDGNNKDYFGKEVLSGYLKQLRSKSIEENLKIPHISETMNLLMKMWNDHYESSEEFGLLDRSLQISNLEQIDTLATLAYGKKTSKYIEALTNSIINTKNVQNDYVRGNSSNDINLNVMKDYFLKNLSDIPGIKKVFKQEFPNLDEYILSKNSNLDIIFPEDKKEIVSTPININLKNLYILTSQNITHINDDFKNEVDEEISDVSKINVYNYIISILNTFSNEISRIKGIEHSFIPHTIQNLPKDDENFCFSVVHDGSLDKRSIQDCLKKIVPLFKLPEFYNHDLNDDKSDENKINKIISAVILEHFISLDINKNKKSELEDEKIRFNSQSSFKI